MPPRAAVSEFDRQIVATHRRFVKAMDARLDSMTVETKERYFAVLSLFVAKLEASEKNLREVMQEMMTDAMTFVLHEMQG